MAEKPMLSVNNVDVLYEDTVPVLKEVTLALREGQVVALLGASGAGKTTTLNAISGLLKAEKGAVIQGAIEFMGRRVDKMPPEEIVHLGIFQVMAGRRVFEGLTARENLLAASRTHGNWRKTRKRLDVVKGYFPVLKSRRNIPARNLSTGEQQMLVIGRALMARTRLMMLDEPSLGLSPLLVSEIFDIIQKINRDRKTSVFLAEQNAHLALTISDYGYVMENGRVALHDTVDGLSENEDIKMFYLGLTDLGGSRDGDQKVYRRRKRWL